MINQQKIEKWVSIYLDHVKEITPEIHVNEEEGYKFKSVDNFQKNFNLQAKDLPAMLEASIVNNNLVAGTWYFPRKMLIIFATEYEKETRSALEYLFNEKEPVADRINKTRDIFNKLVADRSVKLNEQKWKHSFISLRFLSLLLGYMYPNVHNALKPQEWRNFCKFIDDDFTIPSGTSRGEQYDIYGKYIEALRKYIRTLPYIDELRKKLTNGLDFHDEEFRWMAQDVIYVTSRVIEKGSSPDIEQLDVKTEKFQEEDDEEKLATIDDRFESESNLQHFIEENFDKIDFGEKLQIYTDKSGRQGVYYPTNNGEVDILALDDVGNYVVLELKRNRAADQTVNQIGRYMQWVEKNLATKDNKGVRGIIIAHKGGKLLEGAVKALRFPVRILLYKLKIELSGLESDK